MTSETEALIYLYGIVPADTEDPPDDLVGLEDRPVHLLRTDTLAAIVSIVPRETYGDEALNSRLDDLAWVGARGLAHERVLDWFVERGPVVPLSLFSLHLDPQRVERRITDERAGLEKLLQKLSGAREWGVKLWRTEAEAVAGIDRLSSPLAALNSELEEAPPGKRYLLEKKRDTMRAEELRSASKRFGHELYGDMLNVSVQGVSVPIPSGVAGTERTLLLHAAFLVADDAFDYFRTVLNQHARRLAGSGFSLEFTGPWPPYHFTDDDE